MPEIANDCAPLCAVSANYHSKIVDCLKEHFVFEKNYVTNESDFFASQQLEAGAGARAGDDATQFVKIAMKSLKARNEAQLQSGMFRTMQKLESVTVLEESIKPVPAKLTELVNFLAAKVGIGSSTMYAEKDTKSLLRTNLR